MRYVRGSNLLIVALVILVAGGASSTQAEPLQVLYVKGLFHLTLDLEQGLQRLTEDTGREAQLTSVYYEWDYHNEKPWLIGFPETAEELAAYDLVILANVDFAALGDEGSQLLAQYVDAGGGVLTIGGPFAYGRGGYQDTILAEMLPVSLVRFYDLRRTLPGATITKAPDHPLVTGLDLGEKPVCPYLHQVRVKSEGKVLLRCGGHPLLVLGQYGQGQVAAFMGTALGEPPEGRKAFWKWSQWPELVGRLLNWLGGSE